MLYSLDLQTVLGAKHMLFLRRTKSVGVCFTREYKRELTNKALCEIELDIYLFVVVSLYCDE